MPVNKLSITIQATPWSCSVAPGQTGRIEQGGTQSQSSRRVDSPDQLRFAPGNDRGGLATKQRKTMADQGRQAHARQQDAEQIERIGRGDNVNPLFATLFLPLFTTRSQRSDCLGQRELFAGVPADETPASNFSGRFEATKCP